MKVILFFVGHWFFSLFFQTFFLHRYAAHGMFKMSKFWERTFYILTYISQGSSFLNPRAYAIMHRMHHAYSDTPADPHSPVTSKTLPKMVLSMVGVYEKYLKRREEPPKEFVGGYPEWPILDKMADLWWPRIIWGTAYSLFYIYFATEWWM
ncbi:MAG: acyl-CoA desaturase, partial [Blastocatellia bacterium]|nr:acyl-CoA desaturase [Blastocatellia bacterium]